MEKRKKGKERMEEREGGNRYRERKKERRRLSENE